MALSFYYSFVAPAGKTAEELERFFKKLEQEARRLGFSPTLVLKAEFDTPERRKFAERVTRGLPLEGDALKGVVLPNPKQIFEHDAINGECRLIPEKGVFLVVTNEHQEETIFGLFRYPEVINDVNGKPIMQTGAGKCWQFRDFVDSPDPRYRTLIKKIAEAGFVKEAVDEYAPGKPL